MSFWSRPSTTTGLLATIAVLLLVLVIQNGIRGYSPALSAQTPPPPSVPTNIPGHNHPPVDPHQAAFGGDDEEFDSAKMIMAGLVCPDDPTLTLAEPNCQGGDAGERRKTVTEAAAEDLPIGKLFDRVIEKYGESALTAQALQIIRMRKR